MGIKKANTTAYHPQTDGLVERFNRTLTDMLAKTVERDGKNWDVRLPYVLFAYRTSPQESTKESPFYLLYGRDPQLPTGIDMSSTPASRALINIENYKEEITRNMQEAWTLAKKKIKTSQKKQKFYYDRRTRIPTFRLGGRVLFLHTPSAKSGPAYKFGLPYKGPYRVTDISENVACVQLISRPNSDVLRVSISRLRYCPAECSPDDNDPQRRNEDNEISSKQNEEDQTLHNSPEETVLGPANNDELSPLNSEVECPQINESPSGLWATRLRAHKGKNHGKPMTRTSSNKDGEM